MRWLGFYSFFIFLVLDPRLHGDDGWGKIIRNFAAVEWLASLFEQPPAAYFQYVKSGAQKKGARRPPQ